MAFGRQVLVAYDEELIALSLVDALLSRGFQVRLARDGNEALEIAAFSGPFDALLTDVRMSRLAGDELARRMLAAAPELVAVMLSGDTGLEAVARLRPSGGAVAFLPKPMSPDAIAEVVQRLLSGRPAKH